MRPATRRPGDCPLCGAYWGLILDGGPPMYECRNCLIKWSLEQDRAFEPARDRPRTNAAPTRGEDDA